MFDWLADPQCATVQAGIEVATLGGIKCVIANLLGIITPVIIIAAIGMIIFAGAKIVMGADNPKEYQAGMQTLLFAIVGVIGLGLAWLILLLIQTFTGAPVTELQFQIP